MDADAQKPSNEIAASLVLLAVTIAALVIANSAAAPLYKAALAYPLRLGAGAFAIEDTVKDWIKNALMAVFFLYVGLEIKAEFAIGALSDRKRAALPFVAALGGIVAPSLVYFAIAGRDPALLPGWAIPSATDIAFAIGVVALLGSRVPASLKAFLLAVAVIDDLAAIIIIALFYTGGLEPIWLVLSLALAAGMFAFDRIFAVRSLGPYLAAGVLLWLLVRASGINPTLAGVVTALAIPLDRRGGDVSPLHRLAHAIGPAVAFAIMPLFAFANAGVSIATVQWADLTGALTRAIGFGLVIGKPVGILAAVAIALRLGIAAMPEGATWRQMAGIGSLAGIGFTMSLFIGILAFGEGALMDQVRVGVLAGSLVATLIGVALLWQQSEAPSQRSRSRP